MGCRISASHFLYLGVEYGVRHIGHIIQLPNCTWRGVLGFWDAGCRQKGKESQTARAHGREVQVCVYIYICNYQYYGPRFLV